MKLPKIPIKIPIPRILRRRVERPDPAPRRAPWRRTRICRPPAWAAAGTCDRSRLTQTRIDEKELMNKDPWVFSWRRRISPHTPERCETRRWR